MAGSGGGEGKASWELYFVASPPKLPSYCMFLSGCRCCESHLLCPAADTQRQDFSLVLVSIYTASEPSLHVQRTQDTQLASLDQWPLVLSALIQFLLNLSQSHFVAVF